MTYVQDALAAIEAELPGLHPELARAHALLALTTGTRTTPEHVHHAWALHTATVRPEHSCLVPFGQLPEQTRALDRPIAMGIRAVARRLRHGHLHANPTNPNGGRGNAR